MSGWGKFLLFLFGITFLFIVLIGSSVVSGCGLSEDGFELSQVSEEDFAGICATSGEDIGDFWTCNCS